MAQATHCVDVSSVRERADEVVVIDVRSPGEHASVHIPSSRNIPLDELDARRDEIRTLLEESREVVLTCQTGARAHRAQEQLAAAGLGDVPILEGGLVAWQAAEAPVVRGEARWEIERQVRLIAGGIVLLSILASIVYPPARYVAGLIGLGLTVAALTNTCMLGMLLMRLPYNRRPRTS